MSTHQEIAERVTSAAIKRLTALLRARPECDELDNDEVETIAIANVTGMSCMLAAVQEHLPTPERTVEAVTAAIESYYTAAIDTWAEQAAAS